VIVDRAEYRDGVRMPVPSNGHGPPPAADPDISAFVWLGLVEPTHAEFESVAHEFGLHPLAVEDAVKAHQRPKLEHYGPNWFMVLKTVEFDPDAGDVTFGEIMAFIGETFVVTVRHGGVSTVADVRAKLEADPQRLARGTWEVLHSLADDVVDEYELVVRHLEDAINEVQVMVFESPRAAHAEQIFRLKREVLEFRQVVLPLGEALERLAMWDGSPVAPERRAYFRDVHDHVRRVDDRLRTIDDLLTSALNVNVSQVGMRQNEDMRKISAWVAIVAVPTMVAGLYGMNFDHMPELHWRYSYPAVVGITAVLCLLLYRNFKKRGWL
jgi:magnesium transporter